MFCKSGFGGECVIASVLSYHSKALKWQTSVAAQSFIPQRTVQPRGMRAGPSPSWPPPFIYLSPLLPALSLPMQIRLAKKGMCLFHLKFSLRSVDSVLFHFLRAFLFLCLLATTILESFFLF